MHTIIAHGPNMINLPCLFFETKEDAEAFMSEIGLVKREDGRYLKDEDGVWVDELLKEYDADRCKVVNSIEPKLNYHGKRFPEYFFTKYYGGCGGVGGFTIEKVKIGEPTLPWDLD